MFKTRLISGILLVAVALLTIMSGSYVLFFTLLGISLIGMQELYKAMQVHKEKFTLLEITGYVGAVVYYIAMAADYEKYGMMGLILALILLLFVYVFTYPRFHAGEAGMLYYSPRIFERFYRVDKSHSRETGGTGLGLSIVKHGALIHHAKVTVDSDLGKGTAMEILFSQDK